MLGSIDQVGFEKDSVMTDNLTVFPIFFNGKIAEALTIDSEKNSANNIITERSVNSIEIFRYEVIFKKLYLSNLASI